MNTEQREGTTAQIMGFAAHLLVVGITIFLFAICRPTDAHTVYWVAMIDVVLVEVIITIRNLGLAQLFKGSSPAHPRVSGLVLSTFYYGVFVLTVAMSIIAGAFFNRTDIPVTYIVLLALEWTAVVVVIWVLMMVERGAAEGVQDSADGSVKNRNLVSNLDDTARLLRLLKLPEATAHERETALARIDEYRLRARAYASARGKAPTSETEAVIAEIERAAQSLTSKDSASCQDTLRMISEKVTTLLVNG
jgi:hypothetical protein